MLSMRELARLSGVSVATVSKALRQDPSVRPELGARICRIAQKHKYHPNRLVAGIIKGRTRLVAVIQSNMAGAGNNERVSATQDYLREHGYFALVFNTHDEVEREAECIHEAVAHRVAGMIVTTANYDANEKHFWELRQHDIPFVLVSEHAHEIGVPHVHGDDMPVGAQIVSHLAEMGHRRIAFVGGPVAETQRFLGYRRGLAETGIPFDASLVKPSPWTAEAGLEVMDELLRRRPRPTAVFAANDVIALGVMKSIANAGLNVPRDMSVVGYGNLPFSPYLTPALTTVEEHLEEIGRRSVDVLLGLIDPSRPRAGRAGNQMLVPAELVIRESTGPAPGSR
jgi:DNA-binding LacI/PurR family transcriptional regulator